MRSAGSRSFGRHRTDAGRTAGRRHAGRRSAAQGGEQAGPAGIPPGRPGEPAPTRRRPRRGAASVGPTEPSAPAVWTCRCSTTRSPGSGPARTPRSDSSADAGRQAGWPTARHRVRLAHPCPVDPHRVRPRARRRTPHRVPSRPRPSRDSGHGLDLHRRRLEAIQQVSLAAATVWTPANSPGSHSTRSSGSSAPTARSCSCATATTRSCPTSAGTAPGSDLDELTGTARRSSHRVAATRRGARGHRQRGRRGAGLAEHSGARAAQHHGRAAAAAGQRRWRGLPRQPRREGHLHRPTTSTSSRRSPTT